MPLITMDRGCECGGEHLCKQEHLWPPLWILPGQAAPLSALGSTAATNICPGPYFLPRTKDINKVLIKKQP